MIKVYTPKMLAEEWGCSPRFVRKEIEEKRLTAWRLGGPEGHYRINAADAEEYRKCRQIKANPSSTEGNTAGNTMSTESGNVALWGPRI